MPHEIVLTNAVTLETDRVGFGDDLAMAQRVMDWTYRAFLREGYIAIGNAKNPFAVEIVRRGGPPVWFMELVTPAEHAMRVIEPDGVIVNVPLEGSRSEAVRKFTEIIMSLEAKGCTLIRASDGVMKWSALDANGLTTMELVEVRQ